MIREKLERGNDKREGQPERGSDNKHEQPERGSDGKSEQPDETYPEQEKLGRGRG
jgi:hypothetical protein